MINMNVFLIYFQWRIFFIFSLFDRFRFDKKLNLHQLFLQPQSKRKKKKKEHFLNYYK